VVVHPFAITAVHVLPIYTPWWREALQIGVNCLVKENMMEMMGVAKN